MHGLLGGRSEGTVQATLTSEITVANMRPLSEAKCDAITKSIVKG